MNQKELLCPKRFRPTLSISWLLILSAAVSVVFGWYARSAPDRARARSLDAEVCLSIDHGASIGHIYYTWTTTPPRLPILDASGDVSPTSCGPHVDLSKLLLEPESFDDLVPVLRQLLPGDGRSHVAIYLHSTTTGRTTIVQTAALELPHCIVFDEFRHYSNRTKTGE